MVGFADCTCQCGRNVSIRKAPVKTQCMLATRVPPLTRAHVHLSFTVLTPSLLRMEFSPTGTFQDGRSLPIWNRVLPVPSFTKTISNKTTVIETSALVLTHTDDGAPFSDASLAVVRLVPAFWTNVTTWTPSQTPDRDAGQLFGTFHK